MHNGPEKQHANSPIPPRRRSAKYNNHRCLPNTWPLRPWRSPVIVVALLMAAIGTGLADPRSKFAVKPPAPKCSIAVLKERADAPLLEAFAS